MFELLGAGLANVMQVKYLLPLALGTPAGIVGGALPGVTITMTITSWCCPSPSASIRCRASRP